MLVLASCKIHPTSEFQKDQKKRENSKNLKEKNVKRRNFERKNVKRRKFERKNVKRIKIVLLIPRSERSNQVTMSTAGKKRGRPAKGKVKEKV
jgi:hypothetical protein